MINFIVLKESLKEKGGVVGERRLRRRQSMAEGYLTVGSLHLKCLRVALCLKKNFWVRCLVREMIEGRR
jgi:hypothetical protein